MGAQRPATQQTRRYLQFEKSECGSESGSVRGSLASGSVSGSVPSSVAASPFDGISEIGDESFAESDARVKQNTHNRNMPIRGNNGGNTQNRNISVEESAISDVDSD